MTEGEEEGQMIERSERPMTRPTRTILALAALALALILWLASTIGGWSAASYLGDQCIANAQASGTGDVITIPLLPCSTNTNLLLLTTLSPNTTTTPTLEQIGGGPALVIVRPDGTHVYPGDLAGNGTIAELTSTGSNWVLLNPADVSTSIGSDVLAFGAKCDGTTDDTAAFTSAAAAGSPVLVPNGLFCAVGNFVLGAEQILNCNQSTLTAAVGSSWIVKKTGFESTVEHCRFTDPHNYTQTTTTLSGIATPGSSSISTGATTEQVGQVVVVTMNSGMNFVTRVSSSASGAVGLADPIPASATSVAFNGTGTGYVTGDTATVQGGVGLPAVVGITATAGALSGVTVLAPGKYTTLPSFPAVLVDNMDPGATGGTVTLTTSGASVGNVVRSAFGVLWADAAVEGTTEDVRFATTPVAMEYSDLGLMGGGGDIVRNFGIDSATLVGFFKDVNVSLLHVSDGNIFCFAPPTVNYGPVGIYENGQALTIATGGNTYFGITIGQCEIGVQLSAAQLDYFSSIISDTNRNAAWDISQGGHLNLVGNTWASATGYNTAQFDAGIGIHVGHNSAIVSINGLETASNSSDLDVDSTSSVLLTNWGPTKILSGYGTSLINAAPNNYNFYTIGAIGSAGQPIYLGPGGATTAPNTAFNVNSTGPVSKMLCSVGTAPGAGQSITCTLVVSNVGNTPATCTISGTASSCTYVGPISGGEAYLQLGQQIYLQMVPTAGAANPNFFNGYVAQQ